MSYTKHNWVTGEVVTADKLNHIEDGIDNSGGGPIVVYFGLDTRESTIPRLKGPAYDDLASGILNGTVLPLGSYVANYGDDYGSSGGSSQVICDKNYRLKFYYDSPNDSEYQFNLFLRSGGTASVTYNSVTTDYNWTYSEATGEYTFAVVESDESGE